MPQVSDLSFTLFDRFWEGGAVIYSGVPNTRLRMEPSISVGTHAQNQWRGQPCLKLDVNS